ncbi:MAG: radical SAM protein [Methanotrichaceae archaeon]|nr:radical SAM protein [Methanotrichaceae archaeon]
MTTYPLFSHSLLDVSARLEGGRIKTKARGPFSFLPKVRSSLDMVDGQIPALAGEELCLSTWFPPIPSRAFSRFVKSQLKAAFGIRTPDQITISITEECPNRCQHCALPDSGRRMKLTVPQVTGLIDQALDLGTTLVIFDGGEPALYKELPKLVSAVDSRACATLFTSGAGFSFALARELKGAGLYAVNVSLDSPRPCEHDAMRGRAGAYDDAMAAVESSLRAGLLVDLYVVLRRENMDLLRELHELCRKVGAHELTLFEVVPTGRWAGREDVALTRADHAALRRFLDGAPPPRIFSVPEAFDRMGCFAGRSWMHITPTGEVYPCACLPRSEGNALDEPLKDIWRRMGRLPYGGKRACPMRGPI